MTDDAATADNDTTVQVEDDDPESLAGEAVEFDPADDDADEPSEPE